MALRDWVTAGRQHHKFNSAVWLQKVIMHDLNDQVLRHCQQVKHGTDGCKAATHKSSLAA